MSFSAEIEARFEADLLQMHAAAEEADCGHEMLSALVHVAAEILRRAQQPGVLLAAHCVLDDAFGIGAADPEKLN